MQLTIVKNRAIKEQEALEKVASEEKLLESLTQAPAPAMMKEELEDAKSEEVGDSLGSLGAAKSVKMARLSPEVLELLRAHEPMFRLVLEAYATDAEGKKAAKGKEKINEMRFLGMMKDLEIDKLLDPKNIKSLFLQATQRSKKLLDGLTNFTALFAQIALTCKPTPLEAASIQGDVSKHITTTRGPDEHADMLPKSSAGGGADKIEFPGLGASASREAKRVYFLMQYCHIPSLTKEGLEKIQLAAKLGNRAPHS